MYNHNFGEMFSYKKAERSFNQLQYNTENHVAIVKLLLKRNESNDN